MLTTTYLINRFPTKILKNRTPYEVLFGQAPSYQILKPFGCLCYASTLVVHRTKLDPRLVKYVFLGYPFGKKGYKLLNLQTKNNFISKDVIFHETIFPFMHQEHSSIFSVTSPLPTQDLSSSSIPISVPLKSSSISSPSSPQYSHSTLIPSHFFSSPHAVTSSPIPFPDYSTSPDCMLPHPSPSVSPLSPSPAQPTLRRSLRDHHVPSYLNDYVCNLVHLTNVSSSCFSSSVSPTVLSFSALSHSNQSLLNSVSHISEPTTYFQASLHSGWQEAMSKELQALESNNTWEVV